MTSMTCWRLLTARFPVFNSSVGIFVDYHRSFCSDFESSLGFETTSELLELITFIF